MTIVKDILKQMTAIKQLRRKFLEILFVTNLALRERVNFRNLSRYCDYSEHTISRQFRSDLEWPDFHQRVVNRHFFDGLSPSGELNAGAFKLLSNKPTDLRVRLGSGDRAIEWFIVLRDGLLCCSLAFLYHILWCIFCDEAS